MKPVFKRQLIALALTAAIGASISSSVFAANATTFSDVPANHWAYSYVEKAAEEGWVTGVGNGKFGVDNQITYAELSAMFLRAFLPHLEDEYNVSSSEWYEPFCATMLNHGFYNGTNLENGYEGKALQPITRYEMAQLIFRSLMGVQVFIRYTGDPAEYRAMIGDWNSVPERYQEALLHVVSLGILSGVDDKGTFNGNGLMTRAEAAVVMTRVAEVIEAEGSILHNNSDTTDTTDPTEPSTGSGLGQKLSSGATAAAGVKEQIGKDDAYPTYGHSDVVSNNGYFTGATDVDIGQAELVYDFLDMVNEARVAEGHEPFTWVTSDAAEEHTLQRCNELVSNFSHDRPEGKFAGEVCAEGYIAPSFAFDGWINSPGHKQTLMSDTDNYMSAARAGNYWIICVWSDFELVEKCARADYSWDALDAN